MFSGVRAYVVQNVLPAYREFSERRLAGGWGQNQLLRFALTAAGSLYHLREQFPRGNGPSSRDILNSCNDYALVRDVWNAAKHHDCDRNDTRVSSAEQICETLVMTRYLDDQGEYDGTRLEIYVRLNDGSERLLAEMLHNVMEMWRVRLRDLDVIDLKPQSEAPSDRPLTRAETARHREIAAMSLMQGEATTTRWKLLRYDYEQGCSVPVDLTGSKIQLHMYKVSPAITVTDESTGVSIDFDVPLNEMQAKTFVGCGASDKRQAFLGELIEADADLKNTILQKLLNARKLHDAQTSAAPQTDQTTRRDASETNQTDSDSGGEH
jgi:hypothetical protein